MNRRNFLSLAALALAGKAAERVFPFRVDSIPKEIIVAPSITLHLAGEEFYRRHLPHFLGGEPPSLYGIPYYATEDYSGHQFMNISRSIHPLYNRQYLLWDGASEKFTAPQSARS